MRLCDEELLTCPRRQKLYKIFDGLGLYAEVPPTGNIRWRYKYSFEGKEKRLSVGVYPDISIEQARVKHKELRAMLALGIDPGAERKGLRVAATLSQIKIRRDSLESRVSVIEQSIDTISSSIRELINIVRGNIAT